jgi:hypothetical protein
MLLLILFSLFSSGTAARAEQFHIYTFSPGQRNFNGQRPPAPGIFSLEEVIESCTESRCAVWRNNNEKLTPRVKNKILKAGGQVRYDQKRKYSVVGPNSKKE